MSPPVLAHAPTKLPKTDTVSLPFTDHPTTQSSFPTTNSRALATPPSSSTIGMPSSGSLTVPPGRSASSRPDITLSIDLRAILLVALTCLLASFLFLRPQRHPAPAAPPYAPPLPGSQALSNPPPDRHQLLDALAEKRADVHDRYMADMPACARGRANTFLMLFMGHSGSTALITSLKQHSGTMIDGLEPVDHGIFRSGPSAEHSKLALDFTRHFFQNATDAGLTGGFKVRPPNLLARVSDFQRVIRQYGTRIVWSYRTNIFKQTVADYNIHYYGDRAAREGFKVDNGTVQVEDGRKPTIRITNMDNLHKLLKSRIQGEKQVADALRTLGPDGCVLPVSYESYLRHPELSLKRVQRFLGLDTEEMHPSLRAKVNSDTICDLVENWDQVCEAFFGCIQWRWMLDDYENGCSCYALKPSKFTASKKYCTLD